MTSVYVENVYYCELAYFTWQLVQEMKARMKKPKMCLHIHAGLVQLNHPNSCEITLYTLFPLSEWFEEVRYN